MTHLLDVNVLVALAWPNHIHHEAALDWFAAHRGAGWATCPLTQSAFVRVSSNASVLAEARTPAEALALLDRILALPGHVFWNDDVSIAASKFVDRRMLVGHRQVTDCHLLALALARGGRLATFDARIRELVPDGIRADEALSVILPG